MEAQVTCVLTLRLDEDSQRFFEEQRQKYFPPERNQIPAHVTLFHTLPDSDSTVAVLREVCRREAQFLVAVTGLRSLGRGVAYTLASSAAQRLHAELAEAFAEELSAQDRQRFGPHVVVQNKSTPEKARALLAELQGEFAPRQATAVGLDLWLYLGGPWKLAETTLFTR